MGKTRVMLKLLQTEDVTVQKDEFIRGCWNGETGNFVANRIIIVNLVRDFNRSHAPMF